MLEDTLGFMAALLTTVSLFPQLFKILKTKSTHDISWLWMLLLGTGVLLWLMYGIVIYNLPIIVSNGIILSNVVLVIGLKFKYDKN